LSARRFLRISSFSTPPASFIRGEHDPVEGGVVVREPRRAGVVEVGEGQLLQLRSLAPSGFS
ncbi:MAG TPA: hypothetical protein VKA51_13140, partial [Rubrobacteraceae bacterium]|nr:hypothetical protein [Rubrobacteraceae bacterium]